MFQICQLESPFMLPGYKYQFYSIIPWLIWQIIDQRDLIDLTECSYRLRTVDRGIIGVYGYTSSSIMINEFLYHLDEVASIEIFVAC